MSLADLTDWMGFYGCPGTIWYAKRLSANDTLANGTNQAGPYIPKDLLFEVFPILGRPEAENPDHRFDLHIDSHGDHKQVRAVWYNNRVRGEGTRNESRLTGFGGAQSALLDPENTGALAVFVFVLSQGGAAASCHVWVCRDQTQEYLFEERLGPIEPKTHVIWKPGAQSAQNPPTATNVRGSCHLAEDEIPIEWLQRFPTGEEIIRKTLELRPALALNVDVRLLKRRQCEYEIFKSVEQAFFLPRIREGFQKVEDFVSLAQTILQSRKSRSGKSLELQAREIMGEEGLQAGTHFVHGPEIEGGKRPDFLFPNKGAYEDASYPVSKLRILAAKTTCKDRWRQVLNEASRIPTKHLLTLQEGVSEGQFREMQEAGVQLVVPLGLHESYPAAVRPRLMTFSSFLADVRSLSASN